MESLVLKKRLHTDVVNKRFLYEVAIGHKEHRIWFPWCIVGADFPERYPIRSVLSVSYYGDKFREVVDWIGSIHS